MTLTKIPVLDRLILLTRKVGNCIEFTGSKRSGYGQIAITRSVPRPTHRVVYESVIGPIPPGLFVCHTCDNPACVRPSHLFAGTNTDNVRDAKRKGRNARGEKHGRSKLTDDQVRKIRADNRPRSVVAAEYGLCLRTVFHIRSRTKWSHLP